MAPILTIFGPNRSRRPKLKFEKNFRAVVAVVVGVVGVGRRRRRRRWLSRWCRQTYVGAITTDSG